MDLCKLHYPNQSVLLNLTSCKGPVGAAAVVLYWAVQVGCVVWIQERITWKEEKEEESNRNVLRGWRRRGEEEQRTGGKWLEKEKINSQREEEARWKEKKRLWEESVRVHGYFCLFTLSLSLNLHITHPAYRRDIHTPNYPHFSCACSLPLILLFGAAGARHFHNSCDRAEGEAMWNWKKGGR